VPLWRALAAEWRALAAEVHVVSPTEYGRIGVVEKALHPFFSATQILQSDGSTLVDAVRVFAWLLSMPTKSDASTALQQALKARSEFIITDMLLLVCFFFPSLKRHHVPGLVREHVGRLVRGACGRIAEIYGGDIAAEWVRFQVEPPVPAPLTKPSTSRCIAIGGRRKRRPTQCYPSQRAQ
jgi:hypothetical protein